MASENSRRFSPEVDTASRHAPEIIAYLLSAMKVEVSSMACMSERCFICSDASFHAGRNSGIFIVQVSLSSSFTAKNLDGMCAYFLIPSESILRATASSDSSMSAP